MSKQQSRPRPSSASAKKPQKNSTKITKPSGKIATVFTVPDCALHYINSLIDPFNCPTGVCIPAETFPIPSMKTKTFLKGRFALGTTGFGFLLYRPSVVNDGINVTATTSTSVGGSATLLNAYTFLSTLPMTQLPFTTAQITAGSVIARVVSYGLRIKYIGSLMNRNGVVTSIEDPDHRSLTTGTFDSINASPYSEVSRVGDAEWDSCISYSGPVTPGDVEFLASADPLGSANMAALLVQGLAGDIYEFEAVQHTEFIGQLAVSRTASHSDAATFGKALEATKSVTAAGPLTPAKSLTVWERFKNGLSSALPAIMQGGKFVKAYISGDLPSAAQTFGSLASSAATGLLGWGGTTTVPATPMLGYRPVKHTQPEVREV